MPAATPTIALPLPVPQLVSPGDVDGAGEVTLGGEVEGSTLLLSLSMLPPPPYAVPSPPCFGLQPSRRHAFGNEAFVGMEQITQAPQPHPPLQDRLPSHHRGDGKQTLQPSTLSSGQRQGSEASDMARTEAGAAPPEEADLVAGVAPTVVAQAVVRAQPPEAANFAARSEHAALVLEAAAHADNCTQASETRADGAVASATVSADARAGGAAEMQATLRATPGGGDGCGGGDEDGSSTSISTGGDVGVKAASPPVGGGPESQVPPLQQALVAVAELERAAQV